jgi:hypothetical protein
MVKKTQTSDAQTDTVTPPEVVTSDIVTEVTVTTEAPLVVEAPIPKIKTSTDTVNVIVLVGSLGTEQGIFQRGETFQTTRERATHFDRKDVAISDAPT